jgi:hypothetical protein
MLILFDQGTPIGIKNCLQDHVVKTAWELGWSALLNGELLKAAENAGFELLITTDKNLQYQQNLAGRRIAIVVLGQSRWASIRSKLNQIRSAVEGVSPGSFTVIEL